MSIDQFSSQNLVNLLPVHYLYFFKKTEICHVNYHIYVFLSSLCLYWYIFAILLFLFNRKPSTALNNICQIFLIVSRIMVKGRLSPTPIFILATLCQICAMFMPKHMVTDRITSNGQKGANACLY